jgi:hypothetical protein
MQSDVRFRVFCGIAFGCFVGAASTNPAQSQSSHPASSAADSQAQAALSRALASLLSDTSPHMRMGPSRMPTPADSTRAATIVVAARAALGQYVDVNAAERDGYYRNMPWLDDQPIYHYNNQQNFKTAQQGPFDPAKPVSLLYKKDGAGQLRLVGAMYATSASAGAQDLDALLPISMAQWHEHVNLCYPRRTGAGDGPRRIDAGMVFLVNLYFSITSAKECDAAGGQFLPVEFGWMAHIYMFAGSDDPKVIWGADDVGNMDPHMRHPPANVRR